MINYHESERLHVMTTIKRKIENKISEKIQPTYIGNRTCFATLSGGFLRLDEIFGDSIVIEFAENIKEAKNNRFQDGDIFWLEEYDEEELCEIIERAIKEY